MFDEFLCILHINEQDKQIINVIVGSLCLFCLLFCTFAQFSTKLHCIVSHRRATRGCRLRRISTPMLSFKKLFLRHLLLFTIVPGLCTGARFVIKKKKRATALLIISSTRSHSQVCSAEDDPSIPTNKVHAFKLKLGTCTIFRQLHLKRFFFHSNCSFDTVKMQTLLRISLPTTFLTLKQAD